jgi:hypothetical protein
MTANAIPTNDAEIFAHFDAVYIHSRNQRHTWADPLHNYVERDSTVRPWDVLTWDDLKQHQRAVALRLMSKVALIPDATNRLAGRAFVIIATGLASALDIPEKYAWEIVRDVLEEYNRKPPITTHGSFRVAKTRLSIT